MTGQKTDAEQLFFFLKDQVETLQKALDNEHEVCLTEATSHFDIHVVILENNRLILTNEFDGHITKLIALPQAAKFLISEQKAEHPRTIGFKTLV